MKLALARPAGFDPATRCLEGTFELSRGVAWRRSIRRLAGRMIRVCVALRRSASASGGSLIGSPRSSYPRTGSSELGRGIPPRSEAFP